MKRKKKKKKEVERTKMRPKESEYVTDENEWMESVNEDEVAVFVNEAEAVGAVKKLSSASVAAVVDVAAFDVAFVDAHSVKKVRKKRRKRIGRKRDKTMLVLGDVRGERQR